MKQTLIILTTALILQSCASSSTSSSGAGGSTTVTQSNPEAPKESYLYKGKQVEKNISTIGIPFEISMADVERQINTNVKDLVFEDNSMEDNNYDNFMCKVYKRENIVVTTQNEAFTFTVPLKVWAKVGYKVMGMSIPPQELNFEFKALSTSPATEISKPAKRTVGFFTQSYPMGKLCTLASQLGAMENFEPNFTLNSKFSSCGGMLIPITL